MSYDMIEAVLRRPKMYTINGTYPEIVAFLNGYYSGLALPKAPEKIVSNYSDFLGWLNEQMESSNSPTLPAFYQQFNEHPVEVVTKLYEHFKAEKNES